MKVTIGPYPGLKSKKDRVVKIKIDKWDSRNADNTIALIAVPILKQLQKTKHGSGFVDDEDVPVKLRSTSAPPLTQEQKDTGHTDKFFHKRFDWVLNEIIWALNEEAQGYPGEDKFHSGKHDQMFVPLDKDSKPMGPARRLGEKDEFKGKAVWYRMEKGPKDTYKLDRKGYDAYHARVKNGCRLFGKYFQNLWD